MHLHFKESGQGPNIVILHGIFGMSDNWVSIAKALSENYRVLAVDLRNHGRSPRAEGFNYQLMAEDVKELIEQYCSGKCFLIGHSMGGKVAMNVAMLYPSLIEKLIVVDIGPKYYPIHHKTILRAFQEADLASAVSRNDVERQMAELIEEFDVRQFLMKNLFRNDEGKFEWRINLPVIAANIENVGEALPENAIINTPTVFLRGAMSKYILNEDWHAIERQFPQSSLITVENAGHWVHAEAPVQTVDVINQFFGV